MNNRYFLIPVLLFTTLACSLFSRGTQTEKETFENEVFSFTIPAGWHYDLFGGGYYDLGVDELVTTYDDPIRIRGKAIFTVASAPLEGGIDLETRFTQTYEQINPIRDVTTAMFENAVMSGYEISYERPWGEPWWAFHDIWVEREGIVYVLSFRTSPGNLETLDEYFEEILDSFRFIEDQG
jgi:hypothetical protein